MKYGLSEQQLKEITDILSSYEAVEQAILFGSRAIDTYKEASDVDIAIKGEKADWSLAMTLKDHFEEETYLPFFFDVVAYGGIKSEELKQHIDQRGKVLFDRERSEWRETTVSKIIELIGGGTPKTKIQEYWNGNIPWLSVVDFNTGNKFIFDTEKKITQAGLENSSTKLLETGDVIISARGTVGIVAMLGKQMAFNQSCYGVKAIDGKSTNNYVYYLLKDAVSNFLQIAHGGVFDTITRDTFNEIDISLPPLPEQKAIAEVLSSLDDKIDLLHRQNKTLEQMAETLFRQWFVEEAGEDWEETTIYDAIKLVGGGTPKTSNSNYWGGDISTNHKGVVIYSEKSITEDGLNNSSAKLLPKYSTVISARGTVGKYCMLSEPMAFSQSNYGIKPRYSDSYFFTYLLIAYSVEELQSAAYGSVFDTITTNTFKGYKVQLPKESFIQKFNNEVTPFFKKIFKNTHQICTLQSLRDTLLPKLISGEVRVKMDR